MIDTKEIRKALAIHGVDVLNEDEVLDVLDHLEAANKEIESWKGVAKQFGNDADTLRTHLSFAKDELNRLRSRIEIIEQQSNLSIPDPMDIFTDQDLLKIAEAWREFDAPSGADEFGKRIYGSIRSALNAYRDRLITIRRMEIIPTDLS